MNKPITKRQQAFLDTDRSSGMVKGAAAQVGCSRELHCGAMRTSETDREALALVQQDLSVELEEEARRRAIDGGKIPIVLRGKVVGYDTRYSDSLLVFLLEANHPEKFAGIRRELSRNGDFCVRWDREEAGRPMLPRMTGPKLPMSPQPPRPPQPSAAFWLKAGEGGEGSEEGRCDRNRFECGGRGCRSARSGRDRPPGNRLPRRAARVRVERGGAGGGGGSRDR